MAVENAGEILWNAFQKGEYFPAELSGRLSLEEGYRIQRDMLNRWLAAGEQQAGWKLAFTAEGGRKMFNSPTLGMGYLLKKAHFENGRSFPFDSIKSPAIEVELCFTLSETLKGPGITREQVGGCVASIAPAFEVLERRGPMAEDLPLGVADNIFQKAFVTGQQVTDFSGGVNPADFKAVIKTNGKVFKEVGAEVIDDQLECIAWLANRLAENGQPLEAGAQIMTGSYIPATPVNKGDVWEAEFNLFGGVQVSFP